MKTTGKPNYQDPRLSDHKPPARVSGLMPARKKRKFEESMDTVWKFLQRAKNEEAAEAEEMRLRLRHAEEKLKPVEEENAKLKAFINKIGKDCTDILAE